MTEKNLQSRSFTRAIDWVNKAPRFVASFRTKSKRSEVFSQTSNPYSEDPTDPNSGRNPSRAEIKDGLLNGPPKIVFLHPPRNGTSS